MKALPRIVTVGTFDPCNVPTMAEVVYETPLSNRQRSALVKRVKRFCATHCKAEKRIYLQFDGETMWIKQSAVWAWSAKPFTKFHFAMLLNQKLGSLIPKAPQEHPPIVNETFTAVSVA